MRQAYIIHGQGTERRRVAVGQSLIVGRSSTCGLVVHDAAASRQHLEIKPAGDVFVCRDLGSSNGTMINNHRVTDSELRDGDRIGIGTTIFAFELGEETGFTASEKTMFMQTVLDETGHEKEAPPASRSQELLEAAYTLMNALGSNFNPCDLADRVLSTTMEAIRGQRGAILYAGPGAELLPCTECGHVHTIRSGVSQTARVEDIAISESVARRVLKDGENVLFHSGWTHDDIDSSKSIAALNLSSIICVPIRAKNQIFGILYIDSDIAEQSYDNDHLLLAAAAGNSAGLALENARNHRAVLEKQRMDQDIEAAWTIQQGFLVRDWPDDDVRFEVYGETLPAKVVGGDFYDFVKLDTNRIGLLIGDVSGKGVPAALTMAQILAEFRLYAHDVSSPAAILARLNDLFVGRSQRGAFCTMCYFEIDLENGQVIGANAGHHPALLTSGPDISRVLEASGPPIGILPDLTWRNTVVKMEPGSVILMYTDGIVEARATATMIGSSDDQEVEYEMDRLEEVVRDNALARPKNLIAAVNEDVARFCSPLSPHDDSTMIALRLRG